VICRLGYSENENENGWVWVFYRHSYSRLSLVISIVSMKVGRLEVKGGWIAMIGFL
jgi:hypothetical protein